MGARPCRSALADNQFAAHLLAAIVLREIAVEREAAGLIGPELEYDPLPGAGTLGDAVGIDRETVRDVYRVEGDLHQIVLLNFDGRRRERKLVPADGDFAHL